MGKKSTRASGLWWHAIAVVFTNFRKLRKQSSPDPRRNWAGDEQGSITSNFRNPNLDDFLSRPPNTSVRGRPSFAVCRVKTVSVPYRNCRSGPRSLQRVVVAALLFQVCAASVKHFNIAAGSEHWKVEEISDRVFFLWCRASA